MEILKQRVISANNFDASCLSIACNTAHIFLPELEKVSKAPFVSMIDEVVQKVHQDNRKRVGLLGTPSTIRYRLYQEALDEYKIETIVPTEKQIDELERVIRNVLGGRITEEDRFSLRAIADTLKAKGVDSIILGCTELPLVFPKKYSLPVYNCLEILAMALLKKYYE